MIKRSDLLNNRHSGALSFIRLTRTNAIHMFDSTDPAVVTSVKIPPPQLCSQHNFERYPESTSKKSQIDADCGVLQWRAHGENNACVAISCSRSPPERTHFNPHRKFNVLFCRKKNL